MLLCRACCHCKVHSGLITFFLGPSKREVCAGTYVAATWQSGPAARKHLHSTHSRHFSKSKLMSSLMSSVVGLLLAEGKTQITKNKAETATQSWRKLWGAFNGRGQWTLQGQRPATSQTRKWTKPLKQVNFLKALLLKSTAVQTFRNRGWKHMNPTLRSALVTWGAAASIARSVAIALAVAIPRLTFRLVVLPFIAARPGSISGRVWGLWAFKKNWRRKLLVGLDVTTYHARSNQNNGVLPQFQLSLACIHGLSAVVGGAQTQLARNLAGTSPAPSCNRAQHPPLHGPERGKTFSSHVWLDQLTHSTGLNHTYTPQKNKNKKMSDIFSEDRCCWPS